jgi:hypothetical protein
VILRRASAFLVVLLAAQPVWAQQFAVFPDRKELRSPGGRFVIRSVEHCRKALRAQRRVPIVDPGGYDNGDLARPLSLPWPCGRRPGANFIIVTDYASKRTSRALIFRIDQPNEYTIIDKPHLTAQLPAQFRPHFDGNDHVYLEGVEDRRRYSDTPGVGVPNSRQAGFRSPCGYHLNERRASCGEPSFGAR